MTHGNPGAGHPAARGPQEPPGRGGGRPGDTPSYVLPASVEEACAVLADGRGLVLAGATDLLARGDAPLTGRSVVDVTRVAGLRGVVISAHTVRIGASTTWGALERAELPPELWGLREAAGRVGSVPVRTRGTLGGNLCTASPVSDGIPPLLTLEADVELRSRAGVRRLPLSEFLVTKHTTRLGPGELLTAVIVRRPSSATRSGFLKLGRTTGSTVAVVNAALRVDWTPDARVERIAVAIGGAAPLPVRLTALEKRLTGADRNGLSRSLEIGESDLTGLTPLSDHRADAEYRRTQAAVAVRHLLTAAVG
ncbi:xanthine dehydrogenase family protein subunit M [Streptomyces sp. TP-A0875]|uniref:FAD binding domain-containing protein n=1 Tax=Streptomyces sp. TP-A0875 TaxID=552354 RepID=UPI0006B67781|nr:FAD binding domain-containing protein [Streptomyces sp. TP-A0875]